MKKRVLYYLAVVAMVVALYPAYLHGRSVAPHQRPTLLQERRGFVTHLLIKNRTDDPVLLPPPGFSLVRYHAPLGDFPAYVTVPTGKPKRHPAIVWLIGGFDNGINDTPWRPAQPGNDQSARAFRAAGIITMYPSRRGGNGNAGYNETLYGEVDDIIAAVKFLRAQPNVDPDRIYLGGHSTGGTLALLVAEASSNSFRAIFALGPVNSPGRYGKDNLTFDYSDKEEFLVRSPVYYLDDIQCPAFVFEGASEPSNSESLHSMSKNPHGPDIRFYDVAGLDHFSEVAPITQIMAAKIAADTGSHANIEFADQSSMIVPVHK